MGGSLSDPLATTPIAIAQTSSEGVATDGVHVYWATTGGAASAGQIWRANLDGTAAVSLAQGQNFPACIALDNKSVYWINEGGGTIAKTAK
jgi:hypothetical protein